MMSARGEQMPSAGSLLATGATRQLQPDDMLALDTGLQPGTCAEELRAQWAKEQSAHNRAPSLVRCLAQLYLPALLSTAWLKLLGTALSFSGPVLIKELVDWLAAPLPPWPDVPQAGPLPPQTPLVPDLTPQPSAHTPGQHAYTDSLSVAQAWASFLIQVLGRNGPLYGLTLSITLGLLALLRAWLGQRYNWVMARLSARTRSALYVILYDKALGAVTHAAATATPEKSQQAHNKSENSQDKPSDDTSTTKVADVSSLVGVDVGGVLNLAPSLHELWSLPLQMVVALALLYMQVRYAFIAGLIVSIALIPINRVISVYILQASKVIMTSKDERIAYTTELIRGLRPVRMLGWEGLLVNKIEAARDKEMRYVAIRKHLDGCCVYLWATTSLLFTVLTFGLAAYWDIPLTPGSAATSFALFQILITPLNAIPWVINGVLEAIVSVDRVKTFLLQPEHPHAAALRRTYTHATHTRTATPLPHRQAAATQQAATSSVRTGTGDSTVLNESQQAGVDELYIARFEHATFAWGAMGSGSGGNSSSGRVTGQTGPTAGEAEAQVVSDTGCVSVTGGVTGEAGAGAGRVTEGLSTHHACLRDVTLTIPRGTLTVVTGKVGSGKSSLIAALLGELRPLSGHADVPGIPNTNTTTTSRTQRVGAPAAGIAYAPQSPWLFTGSVRDNITLYAGEGEVREDCYQLALDSSALVNDLAALRQGDRTWVGERGTTLSGGQRARVGLARALYSVYTCACHTLLLDDVLASLDARTAQHVTHALIEGRGKVVDRGLTVVAVTEAPRWVSTASLLIELQDGCVQYLGPPEHTPHVPPHIPQSPVPPSPQLPTSPTTGLKAGLSPRMTHSPLTSPPRMGGTALASHDNKSNHDNKNDNKSDAAGSQKATELTSPTRTVDSFVVHVSSDGSEATHTSDMGTEQRPHTRAPVLQRTESASPVRPCSDNGSMTSDSDSDSMHGSGLRDINSPATSGKAGSARQCDLSGEDGTKEGGVCEGAIGDGPGEEERAAGAVSAVVWLEYGRAVGWGLCVLVLVSLALMQASKNGADIWVTRWVAGLIVSDTHTPQHTLLTQTHPQPPLTHVNALPGSARHVSESRGQSSVATLHTLVPALTSQANSWPWGLWSSGHTYQYVRDSEVLTNPISRITWAWPVQFRAVQFPTSLGIPTGLGAVLWRTSLGTQADATRHFLVGLAIITGLNSVFTLMRVLSFIFAGLRAGRRNHAELLRAVTHAPLVYMESLPSGRVLNRFSSDVTRVDDSLPFIMNIFLAQSFTLAGLLVVIMWAAPSISVLLLPLFVLYRWIANRYRCSAREIRRLDSVALSPLYQGLSESGEAGPLVRAFGVMDTFTHRHTQRVATYQRASVTGSVASIWLSYRLQLLAACLTTSLALITTITHIYQTLAPHTPPPTTPPTIPTPDNTHSPTHMAVSQSAWAADEGSQGNAAASLWGLCLAYALPVVSLLEGLVGSGAETEAEMVSVERCAQLRAAPQQQDVLKHSTGPTQAHSITGAASYTKARTGGAGTSAAGQQSRARARSHNVASGSHNNNDLCEPLLLSGNNDVSTEHGGDVAEGGVCGAVLCVHERSAEEPGSRQALTHDSTQNSEAVAVVIEYDKVVLRYQGAPAPALCGVSLRVRAGEWVGVVGATGAGKSSLMSALLRLVESDSGCISVYGRDVATLPLSRLRAYFGVVPQNPFLVTGTIRTNLDPLCQHSDSALQRALEAVHLWQPLCAAVTAGSAPAAASHTSRAAASAATSHTTARVIWRAVLGAKVQGSFASGTATTASTETNTDPHTNTAETDTDTHAETQHTNNTTGPIRQDGRTDSSDESNSVIAIDIRTEQKGTAAVVGNDSGTSVSVAAAAATEGKRVGLSLGQQQLLCLARLLLSGRRLVLLDEVTANIDRRTAAVIKQVLHDCLHTEGYSLTGTGSHNDTGSSQPHTQSPVTVLQVAHHLDMVTDHTRVVVMQAGKIVQEGRPQDMLQQTGLPFAVLAAAHHRHHHHS